ncbi:hypothetical protein [Bacillus sinesaloumensis]|uniref:hypothetical protein n=1 Tax=Litchfieldia sinesaloumensis TaxID=1926280 RepID=UPI0009883B6B|nr:hypothetical protein [Bacillus sinesaloumensis]
MNRYLKLVNFEFTRFFKLYLVLIGITIFLQVVGIIVDSRIYVGRANKAIYEDLLTVSDFISQYGKMSFYHFASTGWFIGSMMFCGAVLLIYVFFIWYRDWFGKNTFSYRLLVLPTARLNIYLAKATTILLFILGLLALQLLLIPVEQKVLQWLVPEEFLQTLTLQEITNLYYLEILFPNSFVDFILYYGTGMAAVCVAFTAVLFERSYRIKGIFLGVLYVGLSLLVAIGPLLIDEFLLGNYFYENELFYMVIATGLLTWVGAIWIGNYLLNKKIRV